MLMKILFAMGGVILTSSLGPISAQTSIPATTPAPPLPPPPALSAAPTVPKPVIFHPPGGFSGGFLPNRIGGGSRGDKADGLFVQALVPDGIALTSQAQPSLYFRQTQPAKEPCEVTIIESKSHAPVFMRMAPPTSAGIHPIRLAKLNVQLKPDIVYRWNVAIIIDPQNRSQDVMADGYIERRDAPADLVRQLSQTPDQDKPALYAENGFWYDALQSLSDQIDRDPKNVPLRHERDHLLQQVDLGRAKTDAGPSKSP